MHEYKPYPQPYRPGLRTRWNARWNDTWIAIHGGFWEWFFGLDWVRMDRLAIEFFSFLITVLAVYVIGLVVYCAAIIVAIAYGVWPL